MSETTLLVSIICLTLVALTAIGSGNSKIAEKIIDILKLIMK